MLHTNEEFDSSISETLKGKSLKPKTVHTHVLKLGNNYENNFSNLK